MTILTVNGVEICRIALDNPSAEVVAAFIAEYGTPEKVAVQTAIQIGPVDKKLDVTAQVKP
jgi:hypothetical protein